MKKQSRSVACRTPSRSIVHLGKASVSPPKAEVTGSNPVGCASNGLFLNRLLFMSAIHAVSAVRALRVRYHSLTRCSMRRRRHERQHRRAADHICVMAPENLSPTPLGGRIMRPGDERKRESSDRMKVTASQKQKTSIHSIHPVHCGSPQGHMRAPATPRSRTGCRGAPHDRVGIFINVHRSTPPEPCSAHRSGPLLR